jgi:CxxC motif-containing protein (DUF1111 family)
MAARANPHWVGLLVALSAGGLCAAQDLAPPAPIGRVIFADPGDPPAYRPLSADERQRFDLGHAVFNTQFVPPGTPNAGRRSGLGPLYNAAACDACHTEGAHGRGPLGDGPAPAALVIELQRASDGIRSSDGDPRYGQVLNTQAVAGIPAEAAVVIHFTKREGYYADGTRWSLRVPRYELTGLNYGALDPQTILAPRIARPLFGLGLLEAVPQSALPPQIGRHASGRFNWQGGAHSIAEQTTRALAREMGLTNTALRVDDCTIAQTACSAINAQTPAPEVQEPLLQALLEFEHWLAVPAPLPSGDASPPPGSARLFMTLGCSACHRPTLPVVLDTPVDGSAAHVIALYSDLQLHNLGMSLDDRTFAGLPMGSRWRTAPLWGLGYRMRHPIAQTFLHDGRARSVEEAILWHDGEAHASHDGYMKLSGAQREQLLQFLGSL